METRQRNNRIERRVMLLCLDADTFVALFRQAIEGHWASITGLPKDVQVVGANSDWQSNSIQLLLHSEVYPVVPNGSAPPHLPVAIDASVRADRFVIERLQVGLPFGLPMQEREPEEPQCDLPENIAYLVNGERKGTSVYNHNLLLSLDEFLRFVKRSNVQGGIVVMKHNPDLNPPVIVDYIPGQGPF